MWQLISKSVLCLWLAYHLIMLPIVCVVHFSVSFMQFYSYIIYYVWSGWWLGQTLLSLWLKSLLILWKSYVWTQVMWIKLKISKKIKALMKSNKEHCQFDLCRKHHQGSSCMYDYKHSNSFHWLIIHTKNAILGRK